jgi:hypothetical protein
MAELTRPLRAAPRVIPALVAGIQREAGVGNRGWLDAGDEPRHDKGGRTWRN